MAVLSHCIRPPAVSLFSFFLFFNFPLQNDIGNISLLGVEVGGRGGGFSLYPPPFWLSNHGSHLKLAATFLSLYRSFYGFQVLAVLPDITAVQ
jgi:hypothetical protein